MRALEKKDGPNRITLCSYGFLRTEPHEPDVWEAHKNVRPTMDKLDGNMYVRNTIDWLVKRVSCPLVASMSATNKKKGDELPPRKEYPISVEHTFSTTTSRFKCEEVLYVSDVSTESHYCKKHPKNKGQSLFRFLLPLYL
jgi:hypothetical protein